MRDGSPGPSLAEALGRLPGYCPHRAALPRPAADRRAPGTVAGHVGAAGGAPRLLDAVAAAGRARFGVADGVPRAGSTSSGSIRAISQRGSFIRFDDGRVDREPASSRAG